MDKSRREVTILGVLVMVFILMLIRTVGQQRAMRSSNEEAASQAGGADVTVRGGEKGDEGSKQDVVSVGLRRQEVAYQGKIFRDPMVKSPELLTLMFRPEQPGLGMGLEASEGAALVPVPIFERWEEVAPQLIEPPVLDIRGMIWGAEPAQVIVGGQVVRVGENVGETRITAVDAEGIHVEYRGWEFLLGVHPSEAVPDDGD